MTYVPAFDGIRAIAVLIVFAFHTRVPGLTTGFVGVDIFFVLSGFLITSLLLNENATTGSVRLRRFYLRRFARLTPALLGLLVIYSVVAPVFWTHYHWRSRDVLVAATFLADSVPTFWDSESHLKHTWSLSVEEHYYLLWPVIVLLSVRLRPERFARALLVAYAVATAWRIYWVLSGERWDMVYYRFDMRLSGLILGSWLAAVVHYKPRLSLPPMKWVVPLTLLGVFFIVGTAWKDPLGLVISIPSAELLAVFMIQVARRAGTSTMNRFLSARSTVHLGKISYGIYLYHFPVVHYLRQYFEWPLLAAIGLPISLAFAELSYYTIERGGRSHRARPTAQRAIEHA